MKRVLIEHRDPDVRRHLAEALRERGVDVLTCGGPHDDVACPLLLQQPCPAVDGADVVVSGLTDTAAERTIVRRMLRWRRGRPLLLDATPERLAQLDPGLREHGRSSLDADDVVAALRRPLA